MDIIVTTPKTEMKNSAQEAADCIENGGGIYFRRLYSLPKEYVDRVWYVEDGYIRGFAQTDTKAVVWGSERVCDSTGRRYEPGAYVFMDATTWKWIKPIPMKGFQGWRYFTPPANVQIVGGWKDPKPEVK